MLIRTAQVFLQHCYVETLVSYEYSGGPVVRQLTALTRRFDSPYSRNHPIAEQQP